MGCEEMRRLVRDGVGDLLSEEEIDAVVYWHQHHCAYCRQAVRRIVVGRELDDGSLPPEVEAELSALDGTMIRITRGVLEKFRTQFPAWPKGGGHRKARA
jgi:hypothetical protein